MSYLIDNPTDYDWATWKDAVDARIIDSMTYRQTEGRVQLEIELLPQEGLPSSGLPKMYTLCCELIEREAGQLAERADCATDASEIEALRKALDICNAMRAKRG